MIIILASLILYTMFNCYPPSDVPQEFWNYKLEHEIETEYVGTYELTAYTHTGDNCADGIYPCAGVTVACNDKRLWHKWIRIEGYGDFYVHDTGGMKSNVIDIFMDSYDECIRFGRKSAEIYIVE